MNLKSKYFTAEIGLLAKAFAVLFLLSFVACKKEKKEETKLSASEVYVAGFETNASNKTVAKYWKNGTAVELTDGSLNAITTSIFVSGSDIYVAGKIDSAGKSVAVFWKNGLKTRLTDGSSASYAQAIYVSGSDVYVVGGQGNQALLWKNGSPAVLTPNGAAWSIAAIGSDIFIAGIDLTGTVSRAVVWKNGVRTFLSGTTNNGGAYAISVSATDVYVGGYEMIWDTVKTSSSTSYILQSIARVWKNGVASPVPVSPVNYSFCWGVCAEGGNVYIAGEASQHNNLAGKLWVNNLSTTLNTFSDSTVASSAKGIAKFGSDIFVVGNMANGTKNVATIWKNGLSTSLSDVSRNGYAIAVFVK